MKKTMYLAAGAVLVAAVSAFVYVNNGRNSMDALFNANVEVLASGEVGVSSCLGLWDTCTLSDGTESMAPTIYVWF